MKAKQKLYVLKKMKGGRRKMRRRRKISKKKKNLQKQLKTLWLLFLFIHSLIIRNESINLAYNKNNELWFNVYLKEVFLPQSLIESFWLKYIDYRFQNVLKYKTWFSTLWLSKLNFADLVFWVVNLCWVEKEIVNFKGKSDFLIA